MSMLLETIDDPSQLKQLSREQLAKLADELRAFVLESVSKTGGHLSSNLGVIELTIALHYVFNTPSDRIVWDVGHQTYPHKILTGRKAAMSTLRQTGGISGFPRRCESIYDTFGTAHSSTSISAALGMAIGSALKNEKRTTVAVIGDGAMTAGLAFEALNNAGVTKNTRLIVILNDNDMSISPPVGALNHYFAKLMSGKFYAAAKRNAERLFSATPSVLQLARRLEEHTKGMLVPATMFEEFGFHYTGPIDGHDLNALISTLKNINSLLDEFDGPQFLHIVTRKGYGYKLAEADPVLYHGPTQFNPLQGIQPKYSAQKTFTQVFGDWLCDIAEINPNIVAITPAMREGSGLVEFSKKFPDRYFDVGIAEQHAITFAGGLAVEGLQPVVAIYSTFLQRGYDQLIHDIALQNLPVVFAVDRAGLVGADGASHMGAYDIAFLRCIPNVIVMAPADENECRQMLFTAVELKAPVAVRYPRGMGPGVPIQESIYAIPLGKAIICRYSSKYAQSSSFSSSLSSSSSCPQDNDSNKHFSACTSNALSTGAINDNRENLKSKTPIKIALIAFGSMVKHAVLAAEILDATVANMRFIKPIDVEVLLELRQSHDLLVTIEEGSIMGGAGSACAEILHKHGSTSPILQLGFPDKFIDHGDTLQLLESIGLDCQGIVKAINTYTERLNMQI